VDDESSPADGEAVNDDAAELLARYRNLSPGAAEDFVNMLERIRADAAWAHVRATLQQMAADNSISSILHRQALTMEEIQESSGQIVLLPDFTGDDWSDLESAVVSLLPTTAREIENVERIAADAVANPDNRRLVDRIAEHLPDRSEIPNMATWAGFFAVAAYLLKVAPDMSSNQIEMLGIIVAIWIALVQRPRS
jgi:hypothetical protein